MEAQNSYKKVKEGKTEWHKKARVRCPDQLLFESDKGTEKGERWESNKLAIIYTTAAEGRAGFERNSYKTS